MKPLRRSALAAVLWPLVMLALLGLRLPAFAEPAGNDQSLYMYVADQVRRGGVPYVDAWDQKPPGVHVLYAAVRSVWPRQSAVALADLAAAAAMAGLLVVLGERAVSRTTGRMAAAIVLVLGHPSIARLSGVYVRGQCEVFIAVAVTAALVLTWHARARGGRLFLAGVCLGIAFWLKYNALAYVAPVVAVLLTAEARAPRLKTVRAGLAWIAAGMVAVSALVLAYFGAHGALDALRVATIDYNLRYSRETYTLGTGGAAAYILRLPFDRAKADPLWFVGLAGVAMLCVAGWARYRRVAVVTLAWLAASILSIAVNGARDLPQYFVQAAPALALAAAAGATVTIRRGWWGRVVVGAMVVLGLWRVGTDAPTVAGFRWGGLPQLVDNLRFDIASLRGHVDRMTYLSRFTGAQKYDAADVASLAEHIRATTDEHDRILVFGFAPAVYLQSGRQSASRFFWSRPVILEFAADRPGYGSAGLLEDLQRTRPAIVVLQKQDWRPGAPNSEEFFLGNPRLHEWLTAGYAPDEETPVFSVWRRRS